MANLISLLQVVHILAALLMAWPFYALVAANERGRLGPPLGDRLDIYLEHMVRGRVIPCFVFQATVMVTGLALILLHGIGLAGLLVNPALGAKFLLLIGIAALLSYVHTRVQPQIDLLLSTSPGTSVSSEVADAVSALRLRRKRLASICLFSVFTMAMLGVQSWKSFKIWLTLALLVAIALLTYRGYKSTMPYGWA